MSKMFYKKDSDVLVEILKAEGRDESINMSEINQRAGITYDYVRQIVEDLVEGGFVEKGSYKHSGYELELTDKGREMAEIIKEGKEILGD